MKTYGHNRDQIDKEVQNVEGLKLDLASWKESEEGERGSMWLVILINDAIDL